MSPFYRLIYHKNYFFEELNTTAKQRPKPKPIKIPDNAFWVATPIQIPTPAPKHNAPIILIILLLSIITPFLLKLTQ